MTDRGRRDVMDTDEGRKNSGSANADKVREEVEKLARKGKPNAQDISDLYNRFKDNETIVDEILKQSSKRYAKVKKQAREIAQKIHRRYQEGRPLHQILDRMMKYKSEHKWSDSEYDEFRKELQYLLTGHRALEVDYNQNLAPYRSRINRALGNPNINMRVTQEGEGLNIKESEHGVLAEILSMYEKSLTLHRTVFMHSLMYEDCALVAMTGQFKRERHIASNHIHPLLACMFLPKFDLFEIHMLYSNFGSIIKSRYEKKPIVTEPDSLLYYDITSDPNDVVCEINSPIADLKNRYKVQISLWETVLKLRGGNYYDDNPVSEFLTNLNACRNNLYDNADMAYNQDEGAILRKLLSVFSLRPTIIYTKPINSLSTFVGGPDGMSMQMGMQMGTGMQMGQDGMGFGGQGYSGVDMGLGGFPFQQNPVYTITAIPMITVHIPPYTVGAPPKDLRTLQTIWVTENKTIIPKEQSIIYSKEVLIFYVNRRNQRINIRTFTNPIPFSQLPLTMSTFEHLNTYPINLSDRITLARPEETYHLRSVLAVTETSIKQGEKTSNIITGSTGLIMKHRSFVGQIFEPEYYLYDPFGASLPVKHPNEDGYFTNKPISRLSPFFSEPETPGQVPNLSWFDRASHSGTIYIYAKPSGYNPQQSILLA